MLQLLQLSCKTRTVSIPYFTRQRYAITGCFLKVFSKHTASCICIFSYKVEPRSWPGCVHGLVVSPTKPSAGSSLRASPCPWWLPAWRLEGSDVHTMEVWHGDIEKQEDTSILHSPRGARALPAPAWHWTGMGCRICASSRKCTGFSIRNFCSSLLFICSYTFAPAVLIVTPAPMLTSTSAGNHSRISI